jgi:hypothetical protein
MLVPPLSDAGVVALAPGQGDAAHDEIRIESDALILVRLFRRLVPGLRLDQAVLQQGQMPEIDGGSTLTLTFRLTLPGFFVGDASGAIVSLPQLDFGGQPGVRLEEARDLASGQPAFCAGRFIPGPRLNPLQPALPTGDRLTVQWRTPLGEQASA